MSEVEWKKEYYKDGLLLCETPYINGQVHGVEKWYYNNGQLQWEDPYVNGLNHGVEKTYNKDGTLKEENLWINDERRNDLLGDEHKLARLMLLGEEG